MPIRQVRFTVAHDRLVRHVRLANGREYTHACTAAAFEQVVGHLDDHPDQAVTVQTLWRALRGLRFTQVHVALAFLAEYRLVVRAGKRTYPQAPHLYEEAMEHFFFLAETRP
jgi:hypothetical protein